MDDAALMDDAAQVLVDDAAQALQTHGFVKLALPEACGQLVGQAWDECSGFLDWMLLRHPSEVALTNDLPPLFAGAIPAVRLASEAPAQQALHCLDLAVVRPLDQLAAIRPLRQLHLQTPRRATPRAGCLGALCDAARARACRCRRATSTQQPGVVHA